MLQPSSASAQGPSVRILHAEQILIIQNACMYVWYVPCAWQRESL